MRTQLYINGQWVPGASTVAVTDPSDGSVIAQVEIADDAQCEAAIAAAIGATLATVLALEARAPGALKPCLQLLCYPVTDASQRRESMDLLGKAMAMFQTKCIDTITANPEHCKALV